MARTPSTFEDVPMGSYYVAIGDSGACMLLKKLTIGGDGDLFFNYWREPFFGDAKRSIGRWATANEGATFLAVSRTEVAALFAYTQLLSEKVVKWGDYINALITNEKEQ